MSEGKMYFHRFVGAKFYMPDGKEIAFAGGSFNSAQIKDVKLRLQAETELDKIANVPSSMIYTETPVPDMGETAAQEDVIGTAVGAFDQVHKVPAGSQTVAIPQVSDTKPQIPGSGHIKGKDQPVKTQQAQPTTADKLAAAKAAVAAAGNGGAVTGTANTATNPAAKQS